SDWGDPELDAGHFKHRGVAGEQIMGMNIDGDYPRTSNFMEHGTLAGRIRQEDYRPFLLALYGNLCYAMDSSNRYAPEDALLPGNHPGEGSPYAWSAVVTSELQPALGLRWLLCYEEHNRAVVHLQKAVPKHWFGAGERIRVENCPTLRPHQLDHRRDWRGGESPALARRDRAAGILRRRLDRSHSPAEPRSPAVGVARRASCRPRRAARFGAGGENQGDDRGIVRKSEVRSQKNTEDSFLLSAFCPLNPDP